MGELVKEHKYEKIIESTFGLTPESIEQYKLQVCDELVDMVDPQLVNSVKQLFTHFSEGNYMQLYTQFSGLIGMLNQKKKTVF